MPAMEISTNFIQGGAVHGAFVLCCVLRAGPAPWGKVDRCADKAEAKVWLLAFENRVNRAPVSPSPEG